MGRVFFVSGIDTGIGKTVATGAMCRALREAGRDWISVKMVQTGCDGYSEDIDVHREMSGVARFPEDGEGLTAPQIFRFPSSPLLAAKMEGRKVDVRKITEAVNACAAKHETVIVEGAGGLCVPLTEELLSVDVAAREGWELVLVASGRLGAINHTLLSLEAASARGMKIAGVVMNAFPMEEYLLFSDARDAVKRYLAKTGKNVPVVVLPEMTGDAAPPDFSAVFGI